MSDHASESVRTALLQRFGEKFEVAPQFAGLSELAVIAGHRVQRRYVARPIAPDLLRLLCACALSAPSKSDLQQSGILIVRDATKRQMIADLLPNMSVSRHARPGHKGVHARLRRAMPGDDEGESGLAAPSRFVSLAQMPGTLRVSLWRGGKDGCYVDYDVPQRDSQTVLSLRGKMRR